MDKVILASETFGIITLLVILYGVVFETKQKSQKQSIFISLIFMVIICVVLDALSYHPFKWTRDNTFQFAIAVLSYAFPFFTIGNFIMYLYVHINVKTPRAKILFRIGLIYCIFQTVMSLFYSINGKLFFFENNDIYTGEYYEGYLLAYVILFAYVVFIIFIFRKELGAHDSLAALMFIFIPIICVIINIFFPELAFAIAAMPLSILLINIMLQSERESHLMASEKATYFLAHMDELTEVPNRLAFTEVCDNMTGKKYVGVIFCDLNGLKYANDHFGHKAGDDLLCELAAILKSNFKNENIFRISGDEFVVIIKNISMGEFNQKYTQLKEQINSQKRPIASVGHAHGIEYNINKLLDISEAQMYEDKKEFYGKFPEFARK